MSKDKIPTPAKKPNTVANWQLDPLCEALKDAEYLQIPEVKTIKGWLDHFKMSCD